ncbi:hypothetical protein [Staphylococcus kloosii]|nr:hypothetical protein [Staphylococcus kloosii]
MEIKNEKFIDINGEIKVKIPVFTMEGLGKEMKRQEEIKNKGDKK